jgi:GxxExxY protein
MRYDRALEGKDLLTEAIIRAAITVHRHLGPGLLESTYEQCLCWDLMDAGLNYTRQVMIPIIYKGRSVESVYRPDLVVESRVMIEIKAVDRLALVHEAQLLTYMKHTKVRTGLLMNFNCANMKLGLRRFSL